MPRLQQIEVGEGREASRAEKVALSAADAFKDYPQEARAAMAELGKRRVRPRGWPSRRREGNC